MFGMKTSAPVEEEEEAGPAKKTSRRQVRLQARPIRFTALTAEKPALFTAEQIKEFKTLGVEPGSFAPSGLIVVRK